MSNKIDKPKKTVSELLEHMKKKGITFKYIDEETALKILSNTNNYLRISSYRKNYQKHQKGSEQGKYLKLDFSYLYEMSIIDMHYRFLVQKMCSDIEHSMCVQFINDIENDLTTDGYDIVENFFVL